jgi:hypothetical protein
MVVRFWPLWVMVLVAACGRTAQHGGNSSTGAGGSANAAGTGGTSPGGSSGVGGDLPLACPGSEPPDVPLRLLADYELENELQQLDAQLDDQARLPTRSRLFQDEPDVVTPQLVSAQRELAQRVARDVASNSSKLESLTGCVIANETSCREKVIQFVLRRLFRGLGSAESEGELQAVFDEGQRLGGDIESGIRAVLELALQSPEFLYRFELGRPATEREPPWAEPTDLEMASRLSFLLWDGGPDEVLLAAGEAGELSAPEAIESHARRMLEDPRAARPVARFYRELLGVSSPYGYDSVSNPDFTPAIYDLMRQELSQFAVDATLSGAGSYQTLFAPYTLVSDPLAKFYGYAPVNSDLFRRVELDPARHAGLLSMGAWLTSGSPNLTNPTRRGAAISRGLLCVDIPPEPPGLPIDAPDAPRPSSALTTRQRFEQHATQPACAGCHQLMDPIGFGLEHFDATGRWRDLDNGLPVDSSGEVLLDGGKVAFDGAPALARALLASSGARECYITQWQRFAFGRHQADASQCSHSDLREAFFGSAENLRELLVALTQTESFRYRSAQQAQP